MADTKPTVILYSTPWCAFCKTEKQYLEHLGVSFVVKDIEKDASAMEELMAKVDGQHSGVPVTDIDGVIVRGFDRKKIDDTLRAKGLIS
ncbi:MAG: glutaredoxin domain-containing protein [Candidatus Saccharimonas sp.]